MSLKTTPIALPSGHCTGYHRDAAERQPRHGTPPFTSGVEMGEDEFDASPSTGLYAMRTNGIVIDGER